MLTLYLALGLFIRIRYSNPMSTLGFREPLNSLTAERRFNTWITQLLP